MIQREDTLIVEGGSGVTRLMRGPQPRANGPREAQGRAPAGSSMP
jgi:hypothetical protein